MRQPLGVPRPSDPDRRRFPGRREPPLARHAADRPLGRGLAPRRGRGLGRGRDFPGADEDYDDPDGPPVRARERKNLLPLYAGLGGVAVLLIVIVAVLAARGDKAPPRKPSAATAARKTAPPARPQPNPVSPVTWSDGTPSVPRSTPVSLAYDPGHNQTSEFRGDEPRPPLVAAATTRPVGDPGAVQGKDKEKKRVSRRSRNLTSTPRPKATKSPKPKSHGPADPAADPPATEVAGPLDPAVAELNELFRKYGERVVPLFARVMATGDAFQGGQEVVTREQLDLLRQGLDLCTGLLTEARPIEPRLPLTPDEHDLLRQGLPLLTSALQDARGVIDRLKPGDPPPEAQLKELKGRYESRFEALGALPGLETIGDHLKALGVDPRLLLGDLLNQFMAGPQDVPTSGEVWSEKDFTEDPPPVAGNGDDDKVIIVDQ